MDPLLWANFTELRELDLGFNDFEGPIPDIFHEVANLGEHLLSSPWSSGLP